MLNESQLIRRDKAIAEAIEAGYTYPEGIRDPFKLTAPRGRYQGEPFYTVYFHGVALNGFADEPFMEGDTVAADVVPLDDDDRAAFDLAPGASFLALWYSDAGFVTLEILTASEYDLLREVYETPEESFTEEDLTDE